MVAALLLALAAIAAAAALAVASDALPRSLLTQIAIDLDDAPVGVAVDSARGCAWTYSDVTLRLTKINTTTNTVVGTYDSGVSPDGIVVDPVTGGPLIYTANADNCDVVRLALDGSIVGTYAVGDLGRAIAVDSNSNIFVAVYGYSTTKGRVAKLDSSGTPLANFTLVGIPGAMAVDASDNVWVCLLAFTDAGNLLDVVGTNVVKFSNTGAVLFNATGFSLPQAIVFDSSGYAWVHDQNATGISTSPDSGHLLKVDPNTGIILEDYALSPFILDAALAYDSDSNSIFVAELDSSVDPAPILQIDAATGNVVQVFSVPQGRNNIAAAKQTVWVPSEGSSTLVKIAPEDTWAPSASPTNAPTSAAPTSNAPTSLAPTTAAPTPPFTAYTPRGTIDDGENNWGNFTPAYAPVSIGAFDKVVFRFDQSAHTVVASPTCGPSGPDLSSGGVFTFNPQTYAGGALAQSGGSVTFICGVSTHCAQGLIVTISVQAQPSASPTSASPTTHAPTSVSPTSASPSSSSPSSQAPTSTSPSSHAPTTAAPTSAAPTTQSPTSAKPTTTALPTLQPSTTPTHYGDTYAPSKAPTRRPSKAPTHSPTRRPSTTGSPTTGAPSTAAPLSTAPTSAAPSTAAPTPQLRSPTASPAKGGGAPTINVATLVTSVPIQYIAGGVAGGIVALAVLGAAGVLLNRRLRGGGSALTGGQAVPLMATPAVDIQQRASVNYPVPQHAQQQQQPRVQSFNGAQAQRHDPA